MILKTQSNRRLAYKFSTLSQIPIRASEVKSFRFEFVFDLKKIVGDIVRSITNKKK